MRPHLQGIDHVVIAVASLDRAAADFERLGFTLTPRGRHTMGSLNHCAMFGDDYFELLEVPADHPLTRYYNDFLKHGDGLAAVALKTDDAEGFRAGMLAAGIACPPTADFSRPVELPGGARDAAFRIAQLELSETPGGRCFACQHFTRDVVWRPEYTTHANGVTGLARLTLACADDTVEATRQTYGKLFDTTPASSIATGNTPLDVLSKQQFNGRFAAPLANDARPLPAFAALGFVVRDLAATQRHLDEAGIAWRRLPIGAIAVSGPEAHGITLTFEQGSAA